MEPDILLPELVQSEPVQRAQRGSLSTNQCEVGEWVWLPEQPQAGAHAQVATVSALTLAKVQHIYANGAIDVQVFDEQNMSFSGVDMRLPRPRTLLEAEQRLLRLTSLRPHWVGQHVRLLDHPIVPSRFCFNAEHYDRHIERTGGLQAVFDAGSGWRPHYFLHQASHEFSAQLRLRGRPRFGVMPHNTSDALWSNWVRSRPNCPELWGSPDGSVSEVARIVSIDLHARCELPTFEGSVELEPSRRVNLTWGTADVQCFDPVSMTYTGELLHGVPLYLVHGLHHSAALAEARAGATMVACRKAHIFDAVAAVAADTNGYFNCVNHAVGSFNTLFEDILECADVGALSCLLASWGDPLMAEMVALRQGEADLGSMMQAMLLEQVGLADLGGPTCEMHPGDCSCELFFHFEQGTPDRFNAYIQSCYPLLSDFLCCERSRVWLFEDCNTAVPAAVNELPGPSMQYGAGPQDVDDDGYESGPNPRCPKCTTESVSWYDTHDPPDGGECYDCGYVHRIVMQDEDEEEDMEEDERATSGSWGSGASLHTVVAAVMRATCD